MSLRELFDEPAEVDRGTGSVSRTRRARLLCLWIIAPERELWVVAIVAMFGDVILTTYGLEIGLQEMNPAARGALDASGVFGLFGLKLWALTVGACCRPLLDNQYGGIVPLALAIPSVFAVCFNAALIVLISV